AVEEFVAPSVERILDALDVAQVRADADDHEFLPGTGRWQRAALTEGGRRPARRPLHHSASLSGPPPRAGEELVTVPDPSARACGVGVAPRVKLDDRSAEAQCGVDLAIGGLDEQTDADSRRA